MKSATIQTHVEVYCHCPYCEALISSEQNATEQDFVDGNKLTCPECGKKLWVKN